MTVANYRRNAFLKLSFWGLCIVTVWVFVSTISLIPRADCPVEGVDSWKVDGPTQEKRENDDGIDWSDSIFKRKGWDVDPVVIESHKLLFFTVPKNACSTFKRLFRRMMGYSDWLTRSPHDPAQNGLNYLGHYSREEQLMMMTSPDWTRAIFVRDPLERALSAYMDKALQSDGATVEGSYIKRHCCGMEDVKLFRPRGKGCEKFPLFPYSNPLDSSNFPFGTFVNNFMADCNDPHWRPQSKRMDKASNWKLINFVGKFENRMEDTHALLKQIGAFEEFGKSGWGSSENKSLAIFETNLAGHKTGSAEKMKQYYNPSLQKRVFRHYWRDYKFELFNFTIPPNMDLIK